MTGTSMTCFHCTPASGGPESAQFEIWIPEEVVCRSDVLQTAIDAGDEPVQLVLPQEADCQFFDAWIQLVQAKRSRLLLSQSMSMADVLRGLLVRPCQTALQFMPLSTHPQAQIAVNWSWIPTEALGTGGRLVC